MNYLMKLAGGQDVLPAYHALMRMPELWVKDRVVLRAPGAAPECENWFQFDMLPQFRQFIFGIMARIEGEVLGPVELLRVDMGQEVFLDSVKWQRYLLTVNCMPGTVLSVGTDSTMLLPGDVWWSDGGQTAKLVNNSQDHFVALSVCARPNGPATFMPEPQP